MPRDYEIKGAFLQAISRDGRGRQVVTTGTFLRKLEAFSHIWMLQQCNQWIRREQHIFRELVTIGGDNRTYALINMGYVR
ncbi:hypothetical protein ABIB18_000003 [Pantoea sp. UYEF8]